MEEVAGRGRLEVDGVRPPDTVFQFWVVLMSQVPLTVPFHRIVSVHSQIELCSPKTGCVTRDFLGVKVGKRAAG